MLEIKVSPDQPQIYGKTQKDSQAIAMAKKNLEQVRSRLTVWEQVNPEHPKLFAWQDRMEQQVFFH